MRYAPKTAVSRLEPLTGPRLQMVLGTLLGDSFIVWPRAGRRHPRFQCTHGHRQRDYILHKAEVLSPYLNAPPRERDNHSFGKTYRLITIYTVTSPAFVFLRGLAYAEDADGRPRKHVTRDWASALDWRSLAYWHMDDGSLKRDGSVILCTHGFPRVEVEILADRLRDFGVSALVDPERRGEKTYWTLRLRRADAKVFLGGVRPFLHPSMSFKGVFVERLRPCVGCGVPVHVGHRGSAKFFSCERLDCIARRISETKAAYAARRRERYLAGRGAT